MRDYLVGEDDNPTQMVGNYDIKNLPGFKKMELIESGEMEIDRFITPANMPGRKLAALREGHRDRIQKIVDENRKKMPKEDNPYVPGDYITYKGKSYEVLEVDTEKGIKFERKNTSGELKRIWVHHSKVEKG